MRLRKSTINPAPESSYSYNTTRNLWNNKPESVALSSAILIFDADAKVFVFIFLLCEKENTDCPSIFASVSLQIANMSWTFTSSFAFTPVIILRKNASSSKGDKKLSYHRETGRQLRMSSLPRLAN